MRKRMPITYQQLYQILSSVYGGGEAKAMIQLVMEVGFGYSFADVLSGGLEQMSEDDENRLDELIDRLLKGEPVQYVLGQADFCGRTFRVAPGVLIPRPETEELCQWIISDLVGSSTAPLSSSLSLSPSFPSPHVLDIGTGSGCIAVTLAKDIPHARVTAWDISEEALLIARDNAEQLAAEVHFIKQNALQAPLHQHCWDVIVSNPPYICQKESRQMDKNVLEHEPHSALFVPDNDPLLFYDAIVRYAQTALKEGGAMYFEINPLWIEALQILLKKMGWESVIVRNDAFGKLRMVKAQR